MRSVWLLIAASSLFALAACGDDTPPAGRAALRLVRTADGFIEVEIAGAAENPRAVQVELEIESEATHLVEDARSAAGLGTDTVRSASRGTNRAMLFVGDKRGLLLPKSGPLARFKVVPSGGDGSAEARVRIQSAEVVSSTPHRIEVELGAAVTAR